MIFVTVGTHEQQFNRLVEYMDKWAKESNEEVIIQTGFSTYKPKYCKWQKLFSYGEMNRLVNEARIVITHGGPASFISALQVKKIPIVVPRKKEFDEHVNDHQVVFCREVAERMGNIILLEDENQLGIQIKNYDTSVKNNNASMRSNNKYFCDKIELMVGEMLS